MNFKVTILVENTAHLGSKGLIAEHGLSFLVETDNNNILFDTGQNLALINNARVLGIDLTKVDTVVLSHGHYDHTGGLKSLLELNTRFTLIAHPDVFCNKFSVFRGKSRSIGLSVDGDVLEKQGVQLKLEKKSVEIARDIMTTGEIPMETDFEHIESVFFAIKNNQETPDPLADDQALILSTEKGPVVLLGCTHRGLINTLNHVSTLTGTRKIYAIMGGLHLGGASEGKLKKIFKFLHDFDIEKICVDHCTGIKATLALFNEFKGRVSLNTVGQTIIF